MPDEETVGVRDGHAAGQSKLERAQQSEQHKRHQHLKQRQCHAQFLALQIAPDEIEEFHSGLAVESLPLSRYTVREARAEAWGSCVTMMMVLPCSRLSACNRL